MKIYKSFLWAILGLLSFGVANALDIILCPKTVTCGLAGMDCVIANGTPGLWKVPLSRVAGTYYFTWASYVDPYASCIYNTPPSNTALMIFTTKGIKPSTRDPNKWNNGICVSKNPAECPYEW